MALQSHLALPEHLSALLQEVGSQPEAHIFPGREKNTQLCGVHVQDHPHLIQGLQKEPLTVNSAVMRRRDESLKPQLIKSMLTKLMVLCRYTTVLVQGQL